MPSRPVRLPLESFRVNEVLFSKTNDYVANLALLQVGDSTLPHFQFPASDRDAKTFADVAAFLAQAESVMPAFPTHIQLFALESDSEERHALN